MTLLSPTEAVVSPFPSPASRRAILSRKPEIVLDLSRLLARVLHPTPTGVDRVEMAYARNLLRLAPDQVRFAAFHPSGAHGRLSTDAVRRFLDSTTERWTCEGAAEGAVRRWLRALEATLTLTPRPVAPPAAPRVYLHTSPSRLERTASIEAVLRREGARFVPVVHDLIPIEFPEYAREGGASLCRRRIGTVTRLAEGVMANSIATAEALKPYLGERNIPVRAASLGADTLRKPLREVDPQPYFVVMGTIEPRKNHLLLLNLWRRFVETMGRERAPKLLIVGRRGWENENILDLLDRCPALEGSVLELGRLPDHRMAHVVAGARAVLVPSFAEGFGLPVVEALAMGVPVIASDLAALREAGDGVPEHLDPLDGPAWAAAILDYAAPVSARRAAQLGRLVGWTPPTWEDHVRVALDLIEDICA